MSKKRSTLNFLGVFLFVFTCTTVAHAAAQRTFVAGPGIGSDANTAADCSFTQPCRNFSAAFGVTNAGGEIIALSPGVGYGGLTINKAITVTGLPGQVAFVAVNAGGTGFVVSAAVTDLVVIRNISFNGSNSAGSTGLLHTGGKLLIQNCNFSQLTTGLTMSVGSNTSRSNIQDSTFAGNTTGLRDTAGHVKVDRCVFTNNTTAIRGEGDGGFSTSSEGSQANPPNGPTLIRVASTIINDNTTAFHMTNAGFRPTGTCNGANILVHTVSGGNHITGNTTYAVVDGTTQINPGCAGNHVVPAYQDQF